jgi:hypothetical protein
MQTNVSDTIETGMITVLSGLVGFFVGSQVQKTNS